MVRRPLARRGSYESHSSRIAGLPASHPLRADCHHQGSRAQRIRRTYYEHKSFSLSALERVLLHAMDDRACEVAVKDGADVDKVEDESYEQ